MATISSQGISYIKYTADGSTKEFQFQFGYIDASHVHVYIDGVETTDYIISSGSIISFTDAPNIGVIIFIKRETPYEEPLATFLNQSSLNKEDLNKVNYQVLYVTQELTDELNQRLPIGGGDNQILNNLDMNNFRILELSDATSDNEAPNLGQVKELINQVNAGITVEEEEIVAVEGQTEFLLSNFTYQPGYKTITVHIDGIAQAQTDFAETASDEITLDEPCNGGERVVFRKNDAPANSIAIKQADYVTLGGLILATDEEALEGTDRLKGITPASLAYVLQRFQQQDATTTQKGVVQLAEIGSTGETLAATPDSGEAQTNTIINDKFIVTTSTPSNGDGRVDGTVVFQIGS